MMVPAGRLRHRVVLEDFGQTPDEDISLTETYGAVGEAWADIRSVGDVVYSGPVQVEDGSTHQIVIRWRPDQTFDHVSTSAGQRWRVRGMRDPDMRKRWLQLDCEEIRR